MPNSNLNALMSRYFLDSTLPRRFDLRFASARFPGGGLRCGKALFCLKACFQAGRKSSGTKRTGGLVPTVSAVK